MLSLFCAVLAFEYDGPIFLEQVGAILYQVPVVVIVGVRNFNLVSMA